MLRLTKRYIIDSLNYLELSSKIRYERYYIDDNLRIQSKDNIYEKEILDNNIVISKTKISAEEFNKIKQKSIKAIIRNSYLYLNDDRITIKEYLGEYKGLLRVEVSFESQEELNKYEEEYWMGAEITNTKLAFDTDLYKLDKVEFENLLECNKNIKIRNAVRVFSVREDEVLAIKYNKKNEGFYDLPGGKIEEGETYKQAVIREVKEETGLDVTQTYDKGYLQIIYDNIIFRFKIVMVNVTGIINTDLEDNKAMWINIKNLLGKDKKMASIKLLELEDFNSLSKCIYNIYCEKDHGIKYVENISSQF